MTVAMAKKIDTHKYSSGLFEQVIDKCDGCERIIHADVAKYCHTYSMPSVKWRFGICNFATHVKPEVDSKQVKINPLKASKRAVGK